MTIETEALCTVSRKRRIYIPLGVGLAVSLFNFMLITPLFFLLAKAGLGPRDHSAAMVGVLYVAACIISFQMGFMPLLVAKYIDPYFEEEVELRSQRIALAWKGLFLGALGAALVVIILGSPDGPLAGEIVLPVSGGLLLLGAIFAINSYRRADEMSQKVNIEGAALGLIINFLFFATMAACAHLEMLPTLRPIENVAIFMILALGALIFTAVRRGAVRMN